MAIRRCVHCMEMDVLKAQKFQSSVRRCPRLWAEWPPSHPLWHPSNERTGMGRTKKASQACVKKEEWRAHRGSAKSNDPWRNHGPVAFPRVHLALLWSYASKTVDYLPIYLFPGRLPVSRSFFRQKRYFLPSPLGAATWSQHTSLGARKAIPDTFKINVWRVWMSSELTWLPWEAHRFMLETIAIVCLNGDRTGRNWEKWTPNSSLSANALLESQPVPSYQE